MTLKLVIFDIDNVLFDTGYFETHKNVAASTWGVIYKRLNAEEENERLKKKWSSGGHNSYTEWQNDALNVFKNYGLTREIFFDIINSLPIMDGAKETIDELKRKGILTATISGSFFELAARTRKIGIDFPFATCSLIFEHDKLVDWVIFPFDYEGKTNFFNALISTLKIKPEECAFVCDGVNDIDLAKKVRMPIAFNARDELKRHCKVIIDKKDLREILKYLD
jgi:phosphoserine phosphatase